MDDCEQGQSANKGKTKTGSLAEQTSFEYFDTEGDFGQSEIDSSAINVKMSKIKKNMNRLNNTIFSPADPKMRRGQQEQEK